MSLSAVVSMLYLGSKLLLKQGRSIFKLTAILRTLRLIGASKSSYAQTQSQELNLERRISSLPKETPRRIVNIVSKRIQPTLISKVPEHGKIAQENIHGQNIGKSMATSMAALPSKESARIWNHSPMLSLTEPQSALQSNQRTLTGLAPSSNTREDMIAFEKRYQHIDPNLPAFIGSMVKQVLESPDGPTTITRQPTDIVK